MIGKNKDGVWFYSVRYKDKYGKTVQKTVQNKLWNKKDVKPAMDLFILSVSSSTDKITMDQLYSLYQEDRVGKVKLKSQYTSDSAYNINIKPHFGSMQVNKITPRDIARWQHWLIEKRFKNSYVLTLQQRMRAILNFGIRNEYIEKSPFRQHDIKDTSQRKQEMHYWTLDEFKRFIVREPDPMYRAIFMVLYWAGLRRGEVVALQALDIDFIKNTITVNKTWDHLHQVATSPKTTNSYREVQMTSELSEVLREQIARLERMPRYTNDAILFGFDHHTNEQTIKDHQIAACKLSGVKVIKLHEFRHSHASLLVNMGFTSFEISKRLGHTPAMVENVYGHWFKESQNTMVEKLNMIADQAEEDYRRTLKIN